MSSTQWGIEQYGIGVYGGVGTNAISVVSAVAIATNQVQVTLNGDVLSSSSSSPGDALNPATWAVQRIDTGASFSILAVSALSPRVFILQVYEPFGPVTSLHRATAFGLVDPSGNPIGSPNSADFYGLLASAESSQAASAARRAGSVRDLANPQTRSTALEYWGGTLRIGSSGDYQSVTGVELAKKLILRRLMSQKGDFFHLPDYGAGFGSKELVSSNQLVREKANAEAQVRMEPEVADVAVFLSIDGNGVMTIKVKARTKATGDAIDLSHSTQGYTAS